MNLSVIGAGFGRTGTLSLSSALRTLGPGLCHSMGVVFAQPWAIDPWVTAVRGADVALAPLLDPYRSCSGFPSCLVWRRLVEENPAAKVVLTVRPVDRWWTSFDATIGPWFAAGLGAPNGVAYRPILTQRDRCLTRPCSRRQSTRKTDAMSSRMADPRPWGTERDGGVEAASCRVPHPGAFRDMGSPSMRQIR